METPLSFEYDETGDILYISKVAPYPEQESDHLTYNVVARRNPRSGAVESLEILFFTRWLLKGGQQQFSGLGALFADPGAAAEPPVNFQLSPALRDLLEARRKEALANPEAGISWEEVKARLLRRA